MLVNRSDNRAVVHCHTTGTARDPLLMCLHFVTASHQTGIVARHVAGIQVDKFLSNLDDLSHHYQQVQPEATWIKANLLDMPLHQCQTVVISPPSYTSSCVLQLPSKPLWLCVLIVALLKSSFLSPFLSFFLCMYIGTSPIDHEVIQVKSVQLTLFIKK